jgi:hypothetical protein
MEPPCCPCCMRRDRTSISDTDARFAHCSRCHATFEADWESRRKPRRQAPGLAWDRGKTLNRGFKGGRAHLPNDRNSQFGATARFVAHN